MQIITSKDNETVKNIKKLKDKKSRDEAGLYIIEGVKMIEEAILANAKIDKIVVCEECLKTGDIEQKLLYEIAKYDCIYVNAKVFNFLTDVVAPQRNSGKAQHQRPDVGDRTDRDGGGLGVRPGEAPAFLLPERWNADLAGRFRRGRFPAEQHGGYPGEHHQAGQALSDPVQFQRAGHRFSAGDRASGQTVGLQRHL